MAREVHHRRSQPNALLTTICINTYIYIRAAHFASKTDRRKDSKMFISVFTRQPVVFSAYLDLDALAKQRTMESILSEWLP